MYVVKFEQRFEKGHSLSGLTVYSTLHFACKDSALHWIKNTHGLTLPDYPSGKPKTIIVTEFYQTP